MLRRAHPAAPPCRFHPMTPKPGAMGTPVLRLMLDRPRAGIHFVPANSRPNLFGGD